MNTLTIEGRKSCLALRFILLGLLLSTSSSIQADELPNIEFSEEPGKVRITVGEQPLATYVYADPKITRPYFAHVHVPNGVQVTRNHPPIDGQDRMDHPTFHPGIWLAFGDLSGSDNWRLSARVVHEAFLQPPHGGPGKGSFAVRNRYPDPKEETKTICWEDCQYSFLVRPEGFLLIWDSTFSSNHDFTFGDQEEMGLGVRVATLLRVDANPEEGIPPGTGTILDAEGRRNGAQVGGNSANWCDYSGILDGKRVGITIFCNPQNLRPSWFHARDYGLLVANLFGRAAFRKGEKSTVVVKPDETLRLQYGVLLHSGPPSQTLDLGAAYADYLQLAGE